MNEPTLLPHTPDLDQQVVISPANFEIELQGQEDGTLVLQISNRPSGTFQLIDTAPGRAAGPRMIQQVSPGTGPQDVYDTLMRVAYVAATQVANESGVPWRAPFSVRLSRWWAQKLIALGTWWDGVRNRDASQA